MPSAGLKLAVPRVALLRLTAAFIVPSLGALAPLDQASADQTLARVPRATSVAAYGDDAAWSDYDATTNRYFLTAYVDGRVQRIPVRSRKVPFDVDLGPAKDGGVVVVYSRCRREPELNSRLPLPDYSTGRGCNVYSFDFGADREQRVKAANSRQGSEFLPTIWKRRVAFVRIYLHRHGVSGRYPHLLVRPLDRSTAARRVRGGPRGDTKLFVPEATGLDLAGRWLDVAWLYNDKRSDDLVTSVMLLRSLGGTRRQVAFGQTFAGDGASLNFSPTLSSGWLFFGNRNVDKPESSGNQTDFVRYEIATQTLVRAEAPRDLLSVAAGRSRLFYVRGSGYPAEDGCKRSTAGGIGQVPADCEVLRGAPGFAPFSPSGEGS